MFTSNRAWLSLAALLWLVSSVPKSQAQSATRPAPFENEIHAFELSDQKQAPPQHANLFIGSSSIRKWATLAQDFPSAKVINRGFGGSQIADSTRYADRIVIPYHPDRIFFYAGDNDLAAGKSPQQVLADYDAFLQKVRPALPQCDIYFISIKPSPSRAGIIEKVREANRLIEKYIQGKPHFAYVDVFTPMIGPDGKAPADLFVADMLHMNAKGYAIWARVLAPLVK
jgi:lysophospholipase L1-like esterase